MGPSISVDGEGPRGGYGLAGAQELQWGRRSASTERRGGSRGDAPSRGFNGAVDQRRRRAAVAASTRAWFSSFNGAVDQRRRRGASHSLATLTGILSFNGAVDQRRRRESTHNRVASWRSSFNGAVDQRRRRDDHGDLPVAHSDASMGPSISVDGEGEQGLDGRPGLLASMGPSISVDGELHDGNH